MAGTLDPNGTTVMISLQGQGWGDYKPDKIRMKSNAKWTGARITSASERVMYENLNLSVEADEWHVIILDWNTEEEGFMAFEFFRNPNDPTPGDEGNGLGAVITDIEFGPQEKIIYE